MLFTCCSHVFFEGGLLGSDLQRHVAPAAPGRADKGHVDRPEVRGPDPQCLIEPLPEPQVGHGIIGC